VIWNILSRKIIISARVVDLVIPLEVSAGGGWIACDRFLGFIRLSVKTPAVVAVFTNALEIN
jgi:hypothetical protein